MTSIPVFIVSILWLVFIVFWIVSAFKAKKTLRSGKWWIGACIRLLLFIWVTWFIGSPSSHQWYGYEKILVSDPVFPILGTILTVAGIALAIWARVYLGTNWGMPMSLKENTELVTNGPYHFVRHPIYSGVLLAMLGTSFVVGIIWLIVFVISGVYFVYAATREEKIMAKEFPNEYPAYKNRTKMLIPFIL